MHSIVKIDNGVILDGKKLNCVRAYELKQAEGEDLAELSVKMDVRIRGKDDKPSNITVGSIEADQLSGLRYTDCSTMEQKSSSDKNFTMLAKGNLSL